MAVPPPKPERWHERHCGGWPQETCWKCQRERAKCRSKKQFGTWAEAVEAVREINEREAYATPVRRYRCPWCQAWHLRTVRDKTSAKRAERERRRWMISKREAEQKPIGWQCQHVNLTSVPGVLQPPVSTFCGCDMVPIYPDYNTSASSVTWSSPPNNNGTLTA